MDHMTVDRGSSFVINIMLTTLQQQCIAMVENVENYRGTK